MYAQATLTRLDSLEVTIATLFKSMDSVDGSLIPLLPPLPLTGNEGDHAGGPPHVAVADATTEPEEDSTK